MKKGSALRAAYDFRSDVLDVIVGGRSAIDTPFTFPIHSLEEAEHFLESYGYSVQNPIENAELLGNYQEAVNFIRKYFLQPENPTGLKLEVPRKVLELSDVRELLRMANLRHPGQMADTQGMALQAWACSILKVMHTIAHIDKDLRATYFGEVQKQIFDRFYREVHRDGDGRLYLGDKPDAADRVDLAAFETKPKKSRESIILKLLHKPENVAEDIFDRVGIRFVTHSRVGSLQVIKYLKDHNIVIPPNIKPSRSRNTLIDLDGMRRELSDLLARAERGELDESALQTALEKASSPQDPEANEANPHSSEFYRAIQFTGRQLIKLKNPLFQDLREIRTLSKTLPQDEPLGRAIDRIDLKFVQKEIRFFYPFEVQVMDQRSFEENEKGRSAHSEYKKSQIQTAMKRVMGNFSEPLR